MEAVKAQLLSHWGSDLVVVNNARVSFDKESEWRWECIHCTASETQPDEGCPIGLCRFKPSLSSADKRLIGYLARGCTHADWQEMIEELMATGEEAVIINILKYVKKMPEHWAPFANGVGMRFRIKAPIPIMRHVFKHKVGSVESEVSRRYVSYEPEVFYPNWRQAPEGSVKQGSGGIMDGFYWSEADALYGESIGMALRAYDHLLRIGVCPEQARFVLPQGVYTEAIVSNSLYGWANLYNQRSDRSHAQHEIADLADSIGEEINRLCPVSWAALTR